MGACTTARSLQVHHNTEAVDHPCKAAEARATAQLMTGGHQGELQALSKKAPLSKKDAEARCKLTRCLGSDMASLLLNMAGKEQEKLTSHQCSALNIRQAGDGDSPDLLEALESGSGCCCVWCCWRRVAGDCSMADRACRHSGAGLQGSNIT